MQTFEIISGLRKKTELKHKDIAEFLGMSRSNYGNKENGKISFTADEVFSILGLLSKHVSHKNYSEAVSALLNLPEDNQLVVDKAGQMLDKAIEKLNAVETISEEQKDALLVLANGQVKACREKADEAAEKNIETIVSSFLKLDPIED